MVGVGFGINGRLVPASRHLPPKRQQLLGRFRARLNDNHFWLVQLLVLVITGLHVALESTHALSGHEAIAFIPVSFYFIPVLYAGLNFGLAGALPTALLAAALTVPNVFTFHGHTQGIGEVFQLTVLVLVACLVARRVDREAQAKERAKQVGARLAQLNATAAAVSRSLAPEEVVRETLGVILKQGGMDSAWITLADAGTGSHSTTLFSHAASGGGELPAAWLDITRGAMASSQSRLERVEEGARGRQPAEQVMLGVVPIEAAEEQFGALGVARQHRCISNDDLSLLEGVAHQLAVALENIRHYQEEKRAHAELAEAQSNLVDYLRLATQAQEEERKRLARDLHDETVQSLVVIKAGLDALASEKRLSESARARLSSLRSMVEAAVDDVRRLSRDLRPSMLDDLGLVHAIDWLVADLVRRTTIQAHLDVEGEARRLPPNAEVAVYRIVQESLHNVEKHSGAAECLVSISFTQECVVVQVADDGQGFDQQRPAQRRCGSGLGLLGMHERARLLNGRLTISSEPNAGTTVRLELHHLDRDPVS